MISSVAHISDYSSLSLTADHFDTNTITKSKRIIWAIDQTWDVYCLLCIHYTRSIKCVLVLCEEEKNRERDTHACVRRPLITKTKWKCLYCVIHRRWTIHMQCIRYTCVFESLCVVCRVDTQVFATGEHWYWRRRRFRWFSWCLLGLDTGPNQVVFILFLFFFYCFIYNLIP